MQYLGAAAYWCTIPYYWLHQKGLPALAECVWVLIYASMGYFPAHSACGRAVLGPGGPLVPWMAYGQRHIHTMGAVQEIKYFLKLSCAQRHCKITCFTVFTLFHRKTGQTNTPSTLLRLTRRYIQRRGMARIPLMMSLSLVIDRWVSSGLLASGRGRNGPGAH